MGKYQPELFRTNIIFAHIDCGLLLFYNSSIANYKFSEQTGVVKLAKISEIDKNFCVENSFDKKDMRWLDASLPQFSLFGIYCDESGYKRMDSQLARSISEGVFFLHRHTSGGRLCFETDSPYVALSVKSDLSRMPHMPLTGSGGFDLYTEIDGELVYRRSFVPPWGAGEAGEEGYESIIELGGRQRHKILIHFPLYDNVNKLFIGLSEDATLVNYNPYKSIPPVVYYGSSITQGGCASRPGNNFPAIVSRKTKIDFLCLGFSGSAHGEQTMADYIASLPMSAFVLDYDHNDASDPAVLKERHLNFYRTVRASHPDLPIIIISAPYSEYDKALLLKSRESVIHTYETALEENDRNVYFIDGQRFFPDEFKDCATVDGCHPNDYGFVKMAQAVLEKMKETGL